MFQLILLIMFFFPIRNNPDPSHMLLNQHGEHRYSHFCPSSHSKSQQITISISQQFLDVTSIAGSNGDNIWSLSFGKARDISGQAGQAIVFIDVEIQNSTTMHLWIELTSRLMGVIIQQFLEFNRFKSEGFISRCNIHHEILRGEILGNRLESLSTIK